MIDEQLRDTIEKYLFGELSKAESERLEADMTTDPALLEQVEIQRLGLMGMRRLAAADLKEKFARWDEELDAPPPASPPSRRNPWIWATIALLLLLTAGAFWQTEKSRKIQEQEKQQIAQRDSLIIALRLDFQKTKDSLSALLNISNTSQDSFFTLEIKRLKKELHLKDQALRDLEGRLSAHNRQIAKLLSPPPPDRKTRNNSGDDDPALAAAKKAYNAADFEEAVRLLNEILKNDPQQAQAKELLPYAMFYAGHFREAIPAFLDLRERNQDYKSTIMDAEGYLLLCYIAEDQDLKAKQLRIAILSNLEHTHYYMANKLTNNLQVK